MIDYIKVTCIKDFKEYKVRDELQIMRYVVSLQRKFYYTPKDYLTESVFKEHFKED